MIKPQHPIVLTCGEPAGIGPDLAVMLSQQPQTEKQIVVAGSAVVLEERAEALNLPCAPANLGPE